MAKQLSLFIFHAVSDAYAIARSLLFQLNAETAHHTSMAGLRMAEKAGILPLLYPAPECIAPVEVMGLRFPNRVGLAAGLDKEGNTIDALGRLGFGFIEIGTITPRPQAGNPKPRLFRLIEHEAIINRMGFNNPGIMEGVRNVSRSKRFEGIIGFNIGKNKDTPNDRAEYDYLTNLTEAYPVADYVAVNLSSPNTPGLRDLQSEEACARLLGKLKQEQSKLEQKHGRKVPLLFKVAPDLQPEHIKGLSKVFLEGGLDGLIATNTTITRDGVNGHPSAAEAGGLSGRPLTERSTEIISSFSSELGGRIPIIGAGGISSADDAVEKIKAGASLVQVYSAFIYQGPELIHQIAKRLDELPN